jgi:hypothetical protein
VMPSRSFAVASKPHIARAAVMFLVLILIVDCHGRIAGPCASGAGFKPDAKRATSPICQCPRSQLFAFELLLDGRVSVEGKIAIDLGLLLPIFVAIYSRPK